MTKNMETLYHYCSNEAFHSIVTSRSIRLSALTLSNDSMEGKLVSKLIRELIKDDDLPFGFAQEIIELLKRMEEIITGLGFCLSEKGDLLSQWRGYGSDATGISIGFSQKYLKKLSVTFQGEGSRGLDLQQVFYNKAEQIKSLIPVYDAIKSSVNLKAWSSPIPTFLTSSEMEVQLTEKERGMERRKLIESSLLLISKIFALKDSFFSEEQEWRLLSYMTDIDENSDCLFRPSGDRIVPYREFELRQLEENTIVEVIIGAKNRTPKKIIERLLDENGFANVNVRFSEASYQ